MSGGGKSTNTTQNYSPEEAAERTKVAQEITSQYNISKGQLSGFNEAGYNSALDAYNKSAGPGTRVVSGYDQDGQPTYTTIPGTPTLAMPNRADYEGTGVSYPGAAPITPSAATLQGQNLAMGAVPQLQNMASQVAGAQQFGLQDVLNPASNPGLQGYIQSAIRPITESYMDPGGVMGQIRQGATEAGQVGSSRQGVAEGIAAGRYADAVGDTTSKIVNDAYGQGLDTFSKTLMTAPQNAAAQTQSADVASAVGGQQEQYQNLINQYDAAIRDWDLNKNWDLLQNYANMVYGAGGSQSTATQNTNPSALQTAAGLGSTGLAAYTMFKLLSAPATGGASIMLP